MFFISFVFCCWLLYVLFLLFVFKNADPTIVSLTNNNCTSEPDWTCIPENINGDFLPKNECIVLSTSPGYGYKTNPQVYLWGNATGIPAVNFESRYDNNGYHLNDDVISNTYITYWNDDPSVSSGRIEIDVVGYTFSSYRTNAIPANRIRILVGNYVNNLRTAPNGGAPTLRVSIGNVTTDSQNTYFQGDGIAASNVFYPILESYYSCFHLSI